MRWYWTKIALGAALVFAVGMGITAVARTARDEVVSIQEGGPIRIPLFLIPFSVDGERVGTLRQVTIYRDEADQPERVSLTLALGDSVEPAALSRCILTVIAHNSGVKPTDVACRTAEDTAGQALQVFGHLFLRNRPDSFPLLAPRDQVEQLRESSAEDYAEMDAAARAARDSANERRRELIDSIRTDAMDRAHAAQEAAQRTVDSIRRSMETSDSP